MVDSADAYARGGNTEETRAPARARVEVVAVHVPGEVQRSPRIGVDLMLPGGIRCRVVASRKRGGSIGVALPQTRDGETALTLPDELHREVVAVVRATVEADDEAMARLRLPAAVHHGRHA